MNLIHKLGVGALGVLFVMLSAAANAEGQAFDFKDPKGVNAMTFTLDSTLEPIVGVASGVSGKLAFDPAAPEKLTGMLQVAADTLHVPNPRMKEKLHSDEWLDVEKYPEITFKITRVGEVKKRGADQFELQVTGDFTIRDVTREMTVPVRISYLPGKLSSRLRGMEGDLLVVRAAFTLKRSDFNIRTDMDGAILADEMEIRAGIVGAAKEGE